MKKSFKHNLCGHQLKAALLFTALGSYLQPTLSLAVDLPDFSFLPRLGLPNKTSNQSHILAPIQLIDIDGDKDLDLLLFEKTSTQLGSDTPVFLMRNKGNVFEPAFSSEEFLANIPTRDGIFIDDINNDGLLDILRENIGQANEPMVILNSPQGLDLEDLLSNQWLSLEDLVGTNQASRIRSLATQDTRLFLEYNDFDNDGDLDFNIFLFGRTDTKIPSFEIFFENADHNTSVQFLEKSKNEIDLLQGSRFKFFNRYGSLFGDNKFHPFSLIKRSLTISRSVIRGNMIFGDLTGDGSPELKNSVFSFLGLGPNSPLVASNLSTNINIFYTSYDYKHNQLLALNSNHEISFVDGSFSNYFGNFNSDKRVDIMFIPHFFNRDVIVTSDNGPFLLINKGVEVIDDSNSMLIDFISRNFASAQINLINFSKVNIKFSDAAALQLFLKSSRAPTSEFTNWIDLDADGDDDFLGYLTDENEVPFFYLLVNEGLNNQNELVLSAPVKNPFGLDRLLVLDLGLIPPQIKIGFSPVITGEDLDQDGDIDLFLSTPSLVPSIYLENTGTGKQPFFATPSKLPFNMDALFFPVHFADLDGDGDIDIVGSDGANVSDSLLVNNQISLRDDQITHVSAIAYSEPEAGRIIGSFELIGSTSQKVIIRGLGPSLSAKNINNPLTDPVLTLFKGQRLIASNDNWQNDDNAEELIGTAFAPEFPQEAVLNLELEPGSYTVHLTDKQGRAGAGKISINTRKYLFLTSPRPKNRSFRVQIGNGEDLAVAEFVVTDGPNQVLIKALGPSLVDRGVKNTLADPELILYSGSKIIASNKDWNAMSNADHLENSGQEPTHVREAAILKKLKPGTYTVHLRGQHNSKGISLIEISTLK